MGGVVGSGWDVDVGDDDNAVGVLPELNFGNRRVSDA